MKLTRRTLLAIPPVALLSACSLSGDDGSDDESLAEGPLTLVRIEHDITGEAVGLVHLRLDPADAGDNALTIWLTDLQGSPASAAVGVTATNLNDDATLAPLTLTTDGDRLRADLDLAPDGWWQFEVTVERGAETTVTPFYALMPDPNLHGTDQAPTPDESADARALFDRAISTMQAAPHLRWTESINTGDDTIVTIDYTQIAATAAQPQAVEQFLRYSATFAERADGSMPPEPRTDSYHAITIGDEGWLLTEGGTAASAPPVNYAPVTEWGSIYATAEHVALGIATEIAGESVQLVSFYSPEYNGQAQAWFVWWVGRDSGRVHRIGMLARAHYMTWDYADFDADITIARPGAPAASPAASPVS